MQARRLGEGGSDEPPASLCRSTPVVINERNFAMPAHSQSLYVQCCDMRYYTRTFVLYAENHF